MVSFLNPEIVFLNNSQIMTFQKFKHAFIIVSNALAFEDESKYLESEIMPPFKTQPMIEFFINYGYSEDVMLSAFRMMRFAPEWHQSFSDYLPVLKKFESYFDQTIGRYVKTDDKQGLLNFIE